MKDSERQTSYAAQAARVLAAAQPSTVPPPLGDRAEAIEAIERALRARVHRRWRRRWGVPALATLAAAAAVLLVVTMRSDRQRAGIAARVPASRAAAELTAGTALHGPVALVLATGTRLTLDARATAQVIEAGTTQRLLLTAGGLLAEVAKQAPGRRFIVQTPDAEVEVKGTRFDVTVAPASADCAPATQTRVMVHEGVVAVRFGGSEQLLRPGATWPLCSSGDSAAALPAPVRPSKATTVARASLRGTRVAGRVAVVNDVSPSSSLGGAALPSGGLSTLAEQNDLLAAALAARQRGDVSEALQWLDRLLSRYPDGQLAGSARAERRRLLDGGASSRERDPK